MRETVHNRVQFIDEKGIISQLETGCAKLFPLDFAELGLFVRKVSKEILNLENILLFKRV